MNAINADEAIIILQDLISGSDEDRTQDIRISKVIALLEHYDQMFDISPFQKRLEIVDHSMDG